MTDDRWGSQIQAHPLKPKLTEGDARVNTGRISEGKILKVRVNPKDSKPESENKPVGAEREDVPFTGVRVKACGFAGALDLSP